MVDRIWLFQNFDFIKFCYSAWCDRILYFTNLEPAIFKRLRYSSYQAIKLSDHFPVSASFELEGIDMDISPRQITDNDHIATELRVFWTCVFDEVPTWEVSYQAVTTTKLQANKQFNLFSTLYLDVHSFCLPDINSV